MTGIFNDRYKIGLILAVLAVLGFGTSLYFIYSLPEGLHIADGYQPAFGPVYITISITFLIGAASLLSALKYSKEVVVFRDKTADKSLSDQQSSQAGKSSISLDLVKTSLNSLKNEKDILLSGLQAVCKQLEAGQGAIYGAVEEDGKRKVELKGGYALSIGESTIIRYEFGEGLVGQSAANGKTLYVDDVPEGYIRIVSGLGSASPRYLLITPIKNQERVLGVMEIASFENITEDQRKFAEESANLIAEKISGKA
jgi:hypothetical protein